MKEVSVVVPIYNVEKYLHKCLNSLFKQVDDTVEVILVNDGSNDASLEIIAEYQEQYPDTIVINKENGGLSDARNAGVTIATGRYIYFLDSDDWLVPNSIHILYDFAVKNQCEVVQGGFYYAFSDHLEYDDRWGVDEQTEPFVLGKHEAMAELVKQQYVKNFAWGKLYLTSLVLDIPFKVGAKFEDSFWQHLVIHRVNRYGIIPKALYYYYQRSESISGAFSLGHLDLLRGYEERFLFIQQHYPALIKPMAASFWKQSFQFHKMAWKSQDDHVTEPFEAFWNRINKDYKALFDSALNCNVTYWITFHCSSLLFLYSLICRVYNHFFAKRLRNLPY